MHERLAAALAARFGNRGLRVGAPPRAIATFPASHPDIGDLRIWTPILQESSMGSVLRVQVTIGDILSDSFESFDAHLPLPEREARVTANVLRFVDELFADRLLFWRSTDQAARTGWRERGQAGHSDPLVLDDRSYLTYVWSRPLGVWRATSVVLARGRIRDEREYHILLTRLRDGGPNGYDAAERELVGPLVAEYQREHGGLTGE